MFEQTFGVSGCGRYSAEDSLMWYDIRDKFLPEAHREQDKLTPAGLNGNILNINISLLHRSPYQSSRYFKAGLFRGSEDVFLFRFWLRSNRTVWEG